MIRNVFVFAVLTAVIYFLWAIVTSGYWILLFGLLLGGGLLLRGWIKLALWSPTANFIQKVLREREKDTLVPEHLRDRDDTGTVDNGGSSNGSQ